MINIPYVQWKLWEGEVKEQQLFTREIFFTIRVEHSYSKIKSSFKPFAKLIYNFCNAFLGIAIIKIIPKIIL